MSMSEPHHEEDSGAKTSLGIRHRWSWDSWWLSCAGWRDKGQSFWQIWARDLNPMLKIWRGRLEMRIFNSCQPQRPACGERAVFEISLQPSEDCNARLFVIEKGTFQAWTANLMIRERKKLNSELKVHYLIISQKLRSWKLANIKLFKSWESWRWPDPKC